MNVNEKTALQAAREMQDNVTSASFIDDRHGGTIVEMAYLQTCDNCGKFGARQCMSYVWDGTKNPRLKELGWGMSVKHYYTECDACGDNCYG